MFYLQHSTFMITFLEQSYTDVSFKLYVDNFIDKYFCSLRIPLFAIIILFLVHKTV